MSFLPFRHIPSWFWPRDAILLQMTYILVKYNKYVANRSKGTFLASSSSSRSSFRVFRLVIVVLVPKKGFSTRPRSRIHTLRKPKKSVMLCGNGNQRRYNESCSNRQGLECYQRGSQLTTYSCSFYTQKHVSAHQPLYHASRGLGHMGKLDFGFCGKNS